MRKGYFLLLVVILTCACNKDDIQFRYPASILAGQTEGDSIRVTVLDSPIQTEANVASRFEIDVNNDSVSDFEFVKDRFASAGTRDFEGTIYPLNGSSVAVDTSDLSLLDTLELNEIIDESLIWSKDPAMIFHYDWGISWHNETGLWGNITDKYIGVKVIAEQKTYYGWIDLDSEVFENTDYTLSISRFGITIPVEVITDEE